MTGRQIERLLGVDVDVVTKGELIDLVISSVEDRSRLWVCHHNLHSAYLVLFDDLMRSWGERADVVFVDGMPLVAASWVRGGQLRRRHRATVLDWLPAVLDQAARSAKSVFHLGGDPEWIDRGADAWRERHPGLQLEVHHGFFNDDASRLVVDEINRADPDLLLIGMGMPRQEQWAVANAHRLRAPVIVTVGAVLGYAAGATSQPPRWLGPLGLEWAWRLASDPRRLARRYLMEPFGLMAELGRRRAVRDS